MKKPDFYINGIKIGDVTSVEIDTHTMYKELTLGVDTLIIGHLYSVTLNIGIDKLNPDQAYDLEFHGEITFGGKRPGLLFKYYGDPYKYLICPTNIKLITEGF